MSTPAMSLPPPIATTTAAAFPATQGALPGWVARAIAVVASDPLPPAYVTRIHGIFKWAMPALAFVQLVTLAVASRTSPTVALFFVPQAAISTLAWVALLRYPRRADVVMRAAVLLLFGGVLARLPPSALNAASHPVQLQGSLTGLVAFFLVVHTIFPAERARRLSVHTWVLATATLVAAGSLGAWSGAVGTPELLKMVRFAVVAGAAAAVTTLISRLCSERAELEVTAELLERQAMTDPLTQLPNRRSLERTLTREIARAGRESTPLSIVMVDVDHFKRINDKHGHDVGDRVLHEVAQILRTCLRSSDFGCRWGGEEFAVVLPNTSSDGAVVAAERLRAAIERTDFAIGRVTVSLGIGVRRPGMDADGLLKAADVQLYRAKASGRNRIARAFPGPAFTVVQTLPVGPFPVRPTRAGEIDSLEPGHTRGAGA